MKNIDSTQKKILTAEVHVGDKAYEKIEDLLHHQPLTEDDCMGEDETITYTAKFKNGLEMDIKLCGVQFDEFAEDNTPWTEAVLFDKNGSELTFAEPGDEFFGCWEIEYDGILYRAVIEK